MSNSTQKTTLNTLLKGIKGVNLQGNGEKTVSGITTDSRTAQAGDVFIPIRGTQTDGHNFMRQVLEKGVDMVVCETFPAEYAALFPEATFVTCPDTHEALGLIADAFYGHPSAQLKLVGVTGTNGKTTTATLLYETFRQMGYATGLISTVCNRIDGREEPTKHTTPDAITLNRLLKEMLQARCEYVFMEVSSHAVEQRRIAGVRFAGGIFTNLTRDHMDYHGNMANYLKAKKRFFDELPPEAFALTNTDDKNGEVMTQNTRAAVHTYALHGVADFKAKLLEMHLDGMLLQIDKKEVSVQLTGEFNIYNLLSVYAAAMLLGTEKEEVQRIISTLKPVNGRLQTLHAPAGYTVIVDYAHTPDALVNVLETIAAVQRDKGQTITVVGAGGDRDRGKRPIMAQECSKRSHVLILTSDNPRSENPDEIISEMMQGLTAEQQKQTLCITDRRAAIKTACLMAKPGDVVLIAGKGHETYQEIKGVRHHFDDREEALSAMK